MRPYCEASRMLWRLEAVDSIAGVVDRCGALEESALALLSLDVHYGVRPEHRPTGHD